VVLIGSTNEDGSSNLAPMSSAGGGMALHAGLASNSKTTENMIRTGECVLNLPSADLVDAVNNLARTTGSNPVPAGKDQTGLPAREGQIWNQRSNPVGRRDGGRAARCGMPGADRGKAGTCPQDGEEDDVWRGNLVAIEVRVTRVHAHPGIMMDGQPNRIDPDKWRSADHELSAILRPHADQAAKHSETRPDSGKRLQATGLAAGSLTQTLQVCGGQSEARPPLVHKQA